MVLLQCIFFFAETFDRSWLRSSRLWTKRLERYFMLANQMSLDCGNGQSEGLISNWVLWTLWREKALRIQQANELCIKIYIHFVLQKVLTDHDSDRGDSDQDVSANGSPMTRKRAMWFPQRKLSISNEFHSS